MDFNFSDEQAMLRDNLARYLQKTYDFDRRKAIVASGDGYSKDVWRHFAELGLLALPLPESSGGLSGSITDVVAIAELLGEHLVVEPYGPVVMMAANALSRASADTDGLLAQVIAGDKLVAFAHEEGKGLADPSLVALKAEKTDAGYRLDGEKRYVLGGAQAHRLVVTARVSGAPGDAAGLALLLVDPKQTGVTLQPFQTVDGRAAAHVRFDGVALPADPLLSADAGAVIDAVIRDATIALCAEAVGAMGALLTKTADYASTRKQFGVPIGSFQAVAHRLADMKIAYTKARATLLYTAALAEAGRASRRDVSILKGQTGMLGITIGEAAVQTHGGVGMTDELAIGHYLKRVLAADAMFGNSEYHFRVLGKIGAAATTTTN
jgi:alkylation response protein AidB-like acyl-CoA dehydrogenase